MPMKWKTSFSALRRTFNFVKFFINAAFNDRLYLNFCWKILSEELRCFQFTPNWALISNLTVNQKQFSGEIVDKSSR